MRPARLPDDWRPIAVTRLRGYGDTGTPTFRPLTAMAALVILAVLLPHQLERIAMGRPDTEALWLLAGVALVGTVALVWAVNEIIWWPDQVVEIDAATRRALVFRAQGVPGAPLGATKRAPASHVLRFDEIQAIAVQSRAAQVYIAGRTARGNEASTAIDVVALPAGVTLFGRNSSNFNLLRQVLNPLVSAWQAERIARAIGVPVRRN